MKSFYYKPTNATNKSECFELENYNKIIDKIEKDEKLNDDEKNFLYILATRNIVFKYEKIANLYACSDKVFQEYLEELHSVIVDENKAILKGYLNYFKNYEEMIKEIVNE